MNLPDTYSHELNSEDKKPAANQRGNVYGSNAIPTTQQVNNHRKKPKRENSGTNSSDGKTKAAAILVDSDTDDDYLVEDPEHVRKTALHRNQQSRDEMKSKSMYSAINTTSESPTRFVYFKVDIIGNENDFNIGGIILNGGNITYQDLRSEISRRQLPFSAFCFDLGSNNFTIHPTQEGLKVRDHSDGDVSLKNPFLVFIRESTVFGMK